MADYIPNCENNVRFICPYSPNCENNVRFPETTCETNVLLGECDGYADCVSEATLTTDPYKVLGISDGYADCVSEATLTTYPVVLLGINHGYVDCVSEATLRTYATIYLGICNNYTDCVSVATLTPEPYKVLGINDGYADCVSDAELRTNVYLEESNGYVDCVSEASLTTEPIIYLGINDGYTDCISESDLKTYATVYLGINDGYTDYVSEATLRTYAVVYLGINDGYTDCISVSDLTIQSVVYLGINNGYTDYVSEATLRTYAVVYLGINNGYTDCISVSDLTVQAVVYLGINNGYTDCISDAELRTNVYLEESNGYIGCISVSDLTVQAVVYLGINNGYTDCVSTANVLNTSNITVLPIVRLLTGDNLTSELTTNVNTGFTALLYHSILLSSDLTPYNIPHFSGDLYTGLISSCSSFVFEDFIDGYIDIKIECEKLFLSEDLLIRPNTSYLRYYTGLQFEGDLTLRQGEKLSCNNYNGDNLYCEYIEFTTFVKLTKVYLSNSPSIHAELRTLPQGFAFPYDSTTFFDLTSDRCCPVRRSSLSNNFYIELRDGPEPYEDYSGIRVFLQGLLHTEKRFVCNLYTGQYCSTNDYSDYFDVIIPTNLNLNFEFDSFYSVKLCYGNFIPNGDYIPIELGTAILENCISYILYSGYIFDGYLSKYFENTSLGYFGQLMVGELTLDAKLLVNLYNGQHLRLPNNPEFSIDFYMGDYTHATFYDYPIEGYTGAVLEVSTIYMEYFVKFNEKGLLYNELIYQNKDGDRVDLLFDENCLEDEYYIHQIKAQCY